MKTTEEYMKLTREIEDEILKALDSKMSNVDNNFTTEPVEALLNLMVYFGVASGLTEDHLTKAVATKLSKVLARRMNVSGSTLH